jgi:cobalt-zinc-cadmium efflux system membrane fusion protein
VIDRSTLVFFVSLAVGCHKSQPSHAETPLDAGHDAPLATSGVATPVPLDDARLTHVYSPVSGQIVRVLGVAGDHVKKGDDLAVVEADGYVDSHHGCPQAKAGLRDAERKMTRFRQPHGAINGPVAEYEEIEDQYRTARANYERCMSRARLYDPIGPTEDPATVTYTIRAPTDGELLEVFAVPDLKVTGEYAPGVHTELFVIGARPP